MENGIYITLVKDYVIMGIGAYIQFNIQKKNFLNGFKK